MRFDQCQDIFDKLVKRRGGRSRAGDEMRGKKTKVATAIIILRSILGKSLRGSRKPKLSNGPAEAKGHDFTALSESGGGGGILLSVV
jgi:hypothetical protein